MMEVMVGVDKNKLRRLRLSRAWTQAQLAKEAGVSPSTIVQWEAGDGKRPHPRTLGEVARALGVEPADLLT